MTGVARFPAPQKGPLAGGKGGSLSSNGDRGGIGRIFTDRRESVAIQGKNFSFDERIPRYDGNIRP